MAAEALVALATVTAGLVALRRGRPARAARAVLDRGVVTRPRGGVAENPARTLDAGASGWPAHPAALDGERTRFRPRGRGDSHVRRPTPAPGHAVLRSGRASVGPGDAGGRRPSRRARTRRGEAVDLVAVLHDTAARLRTGAPPATAWSDVLGRPGLRDVPTVHDLLGPLGGRRREDVARATAVVAAARLAADLGAPLADVLESVAGAVAADEEHDADVATALAGPRATARVLLALPVAGVLLGTLLGADPVGVVTGGGVGTWSAVLGAGLLLAGRWWTARLLARTARAGRSPA